MFGGIITIRGLRGWWRGLRGVGLLGLSRGVYVGEGRWAEDGVWWWLWGYCWSECELRVDGLLDVLGIFFFLVVV